MSFISRGIRASGVFQLTKTASISSLSTNQFNARPGNLSLHSNNTALQSFHYATAAASHDAIEKLVKNNKIVVFIKGVPDSPRCGFSNVVVKILEMHGVQSYDSHDVLSDEAVRQGIKDYSNWPTIPQVFVNGEFIGGSDILMEMHKSGELVEQLEKIGIKSALLEADEHEVNKSDANADGSSKKT